MKDYLDKVKFSFLFNGISSRELELALDCLKAEDVHFPKGMVIVKEGELCERFGLLISGQLQSTQYDFQGNRKRHLDYVEQLSLSGLSGNEKWEACCLGEQTGH